MNSQRRYQQNQMWRIRSPHIYYVIAQIKHDSAVILRFDCQPYRSRKGDGAAVTQHEQFYSVLDSICTEEL